MVCVNMEYLDVTDRERRTARGLESFTVFEGKLTPSSCEGVQQIQI